MRTRKSRPRWQAVILILAILAFVFSAPRVASHYRPIMGASCELVEPCPLRLPLSNDLISALALRSNRLASSQRAQELDSDTEPVRLAAVLVVLLLWSLSGKLVHRITPHVHASPPEHEQFRALVRYIKRSDGRKRRASPTGCGAVKAFMPL